jgi:hypothetical protein
VALIAAGRLTAAARTAGATQLVDDDPADVVELKLAAVEKLLFNFHARAAPATLRPRRKSPAVRLMPSVIDPGTRSGAALTVGRGLRSDHRGYTRDQLAHHIVVDHLVSHSERLSEFGGGSPRPIVVGECVPRNLVDPARQSVMRVDMGVNFEEDVLQDIFRAVGIWHPPPDELIERAAEGFSELFACDSHQAISPFPYMRHLHRVRSARFQSPLIDMSYAAA